MNVDILKKSNNIIFEAIVGSHAYGTNLPTSDIDIRGIFITSKEDMISLIPYAEEVSDDKQDIKYYHLRKFVDLAKDCNPNIIEMLFLDDSCIKIKTPVMQHLLDHKNLFISKKAYHTHIGYAHSQIEKAKGQHKKVHNPKPEKQPTQEDFCYYIPLFQLNKGCTIFNIPMFQFKKGYTMFNVGQTMPARPIPIQQTNIDLKKCHCARVEQMNHLYRLYYYGDKAKGVFRGTMLVPESIPIEDEVDKFAGLFFYNEEFYQKELRDWHSYWDWKNNRNENRWVDQEKGIINYDVKNMMHCCRLLISGKNILINGSPIVKFTGTELQFLKDIRANKYKYEDIMKYVEEQLVDLKKLYESSQLQYGTNIHKIDKLFKELLEI